MKPDISGSYLSNKLNADADQMDVDEEAVASKPKSRKRKKETEVDEAEQKVIIPMTDGISRKPKRTLG